MLASDSPFILALTLYICGTFATNSTWNFPSCLQMVRMVTWSGRLDFRRSLISGLRPSPRNAGSFPEQRLVIEPTDQRVPWVLQLDLVRLITPFLVLEQINNSSTFPAWKCWLSPSTVDRWTSMSLNAVKASFKLSSAYVETNFTNELTRSEALALWRALQIALPNSSYFARCLSLNFFAQGC